MRKIFLTGALCLSAALPAAAQPAPGCAAPARELIYKLAEAPYGAYSVWDAVYGGMEAEEHFAGGVIAENGHFVAAGERAWPNKKDKALILVEFDIRGRTSWEKELSLPGLEGVFRMLPSGKGYAVFANRLEGKKKTVWAGFFDAQGQKIRTAVISNPDGDIAGYDVISRAEGGFLLAAGFIPRGGGENPYAVLYDLDARAGRGGSPPAPSGRFTPPPDLLVPNQTL